MLLNFGLCTMNQDIWKAHIPRLPLRSRTVAKKLAWRLIMYGTGHIALTDNQHAKQASCTPARDFTMITYLRIVAKPA